MRLPVPAALLLVALAAGPARAAQSYDNCTGFVDSLPAVITTQGTWCLRQDASTSLDSGAAIEIAANNVTLDCNHFKVGGLSAGADTVATGVLSNGRLNATVRNCTIRGFYRGLLFEGGSGHLVQDNRFEANTYLGVYVSADNAAIRDNLVLETGGSTANRILAYGLYLRGDGVQVLDNAINGVTTNSLVSGTTSGILYESFGDEDVDIGRNWIQGLVNPAGGGVYGIFTTGGRPIIHENRLHAPTGGQPATGIRCAASDAGLARANLLYAFSTAVANCTLSGNVVVAP